MSMARLLCTPVVARCHAAGDAMGERGDSDAAGDAVGVEAKGQHNAAEG